MRYVSTYRNSNVDLIQAITHCFAPDGGLYMPDSIPVIPRAFFNNIEQMSLGDIAYVVMNTLIGDEFDSSLLKKAVDRAFNFPLPLVGLGDNRYIHELFHGPTLAFKDVSARFMAALLRLKMPSLNRPLTVITATTGNTGAAIANAFAGLEQVNVIILYPHKVMTRSELAQFATLGPNIHPVEVSGNIAQCKRMARELSCDQSVEGITSVVCVNTHNILRILPQIAIFFHGYARLRENLAADADGFTLALPCGNLSNLTSAIMAKRMGLPVGSIVAGCNANDDFVRLLDNNLSPDKVNTTSRPTLARAMDSGYPTNLKRILGLYDNDISAMSQDIVAVSAGDDDIIQTIRDVKNRLGYLADPHTAVAIHALSQSGVDNGKPALIAATAHPAKSLDIMTSVTGRTVELPLQLTRFLSNPRPAVKMAPTYAALKKYILTNI